MLDKKKLIYISEQHANHIVDPSPWPIMTSVAILQQLTGLVLYFHFFQLGTVFSFLFVVSLPICLYGWFMDVITEGTVEGNHTRAVQQNINLGMLLFIASEVMFFFAFFFAFFHYSLSPSIWIGAIWPPYGVEIVDTFGLPLLNTFILLSSGISVTLSHKSLVISDLEYTTLGLIFTVVYGLVFTWAQLYEYNYTGFSINDSVFGSIFFLCTGFHGFHVLIGSTFLIICLIRNLFSHFTSNHHIGFLCAAYYWHFVDVVWLFLWVYLYWWSGSKGYAI